MVTGFKNPLTTTQYAKARATGYAAEQVVSLFSMPVALSGVITSDLRGSVSWAEFDYTLDEGDHTRVVADQYMVMGTSNDIQQATLFTRVRVTPTDNLSLETAENSVDFAPGSHFWVLDNFLPQYRLSRPSSLLPGAVELVDYDKTYRGMAPSVLGLRTGYVGWVGESGKLRLGFDVSRSFAAEYGNTITDFLYRFKAGQYTVVAGALDEPIVIVDFDPGEQWGMLTATDNDSTELARHFGVMAHDEDNPPIGSFEGGNIENTLERGWNMTIPALQGVDVILPNTFAIVSTLNEQISGLPDSTWPGNWADISNKALTSNIATLTTALDHGFETGQTIILADIDAIFNGTHLITAVTDDTFSFALVHANVASTGASGMGVVNPDNVQFVGWLQQVDDTATGDPNYTVVSQSSMNFTGVASRLSRNGKQLIPLINKDVPAVWGEIHKLTAWRGILHYFDRYTNADTLCDIEFDDTTEKYTVPASGSQGSNVLDIVTSMAAQITALPEFAPDGRIQIMTQGYQLNQTDRDALPKIADWDLQDIVIPGGISRTLDPNNAIGYVDAVGGYWNTANNQLSTLVCVAPGLAQTDAPSSGNLSDQILAATSSRFSATLEITTRAGNEFVFLNTNEFMDIDHPAGYAALGLMASRRMIYRWTLDTEVAGPNGVNRIIYTTDTWWTIDTVTIGYNKDLGYYTCKVRYRRLSLVGTPGDDTTQDVPAQGEIPTYAPDLGLDAFAFEDLAVYYPDEGYDIEDVNPAQLEPPPGMIAGFKGQELITWNTSRVFYEKNVIGLKKPLSIDITPSNLPGGFGVEQCVIDPSYSISAIPAYSLITDGTDSQVGYCSNIAAPGASELWTFGATVSGLYTVIRATGTAGTVGIFQPASATPPPGSWSRTWDFLTSPGSWYVVPVGGFYDAVWTPGVGWQSGARIIPGTIRYLSISIDLANGTISNCTIWYTMNLPGSGTPAFYFTPNTTGNDPFDPSGVFKLFAAQPGLTNIIVSGQADDPPSNMASWNISAIQFGGPSDNPFTSSTAAFSDDYGGTFATALDVGDSVPGGVGGFDIQRAGTVSYAAAQGAIFKASTLGGAYSFFASFSGGNPVCAVLPYFDWSNAKNTSGSSPDVLVGLDASDGVGSLKWIEGGGTVHDITPVPGFVFSNPNSITISYNHHILVSGSVSGVSKVYRSTDKGTTWQLVESGGTYTFIRTRRNDDLASAGSGTNKGQCYIADAGGLGYTSRWAVAGFAPKAQPASILGFDTIF